MIQRMSNDPSCDCSKPTDDDRGFCLGCGRWINYRERNLP
jgi:predicted Fe-S protein YdhL (DUF1289 family)